eukprot:scaffold125596_cov60-Phaeocystis_antarctica.AAC.3
MTRPGSPRLREPPRAPRRVSSLDARRARQRTSSAYYRTRLEASVGARRALCWREQPRSNLLACWAPGPSIPRHSKAQATHSIAPSITCPRRLGSAAYRARSPRP